MLPKWARETKMQNVFRISAIQALADTQRPEALPILERLSDELGRETELGRTAANSAKFLNSNLAKLSANRTATVSFRSAVGGFAILIAAREKLYPSCYETADRDPGDLRVGLRGGPLAGIDGAARVGGDRRSPTG